ncbi:MAG TPA: YceI family protein [Candidatus Tumulicola sp.]|nr:YceI family protein [Candidatus Tumulicola sp.]
MNLRSLLAVPLAGVAGVAGVPGVALASPEVYVLDPVHSQVSFEARHMGMTTQRGRFMRSSATVTLDTAAKKGSVDVTIEAASVRTYDPHLDAIVKGPKFFDVERFPTITYKSTKVVFDGDRVVGVDGELTMLGVTHPVTLTIVDYVCGPQPFNRKPMCGGDATATIRRSEWGMTANLPLAPADEIKLDIPFEGYRQAPPG